jgi:small subunit ribosomal protein S17e
LIEKYYSLLTTDFQINKTFCDEVALIPSKSLRNKIAGFVTHLMKRLSKGMVKGLIIEMKEKDVIFNKNLHISFEDSSLENKLNLDKETGEMLKKLLKNYKDIV